MTRDSARRPLDAMLSALDDEIERERIPMAPRHELEAGGCGCRHWPCDPCPLVVVIPPGVSGLGMAVTGRGSRYLKAAAASGRAQGRKRGVARAATISRSRRGSRVWEACSACGKAGHQRGSKACRGPGKR